MKTFLARLSIVCLLIPAAASAQSADELAAQIEALLRQVEALQGQVGTQTTQTTSVSQSTVSSTSAGGAIQCPYISRVLKRGATGADVTRLQQFLALDPAIYPEKQVTGYYGALTEAAVKRFQCKHKLVCDGTPESTGYGVTGPRTAALLALQCPNVVGSNTASPSGFIRVTPTSGNAPLAVRAEAVLNTAQSCSAHTYEVYFGDGGQPINISVPANHCKELTQTVTHTYNRGGTYAVSLRSGVHQNSVSVTVYGNTPTSGGNTSSEGGAFSVTAGANGDPLQVAAQFDLSSSCARFDLDWGDNSGRATQSEGSCSGGGITKTLNHTYANPGSYTLRLKRGSSLQHVDTISVVIVN